MIKKSAVLYSSTRNNTAGLIVKRVADIFEENGWCTLHFAYPMSPDIGNADMFITFGGDGTILQAARAAAEKSVPILGINMGGKGFITELEPDDTELMVKAAKGVYNIEKRMMIDIEVQRDGKTVERDFALNDAVIKGDHKVIEISVFADGQRITRFSGDGTVIATPTGSTAYSLSAGGPIVEPTAKNIIVTPICAHILEAKTFVLTANRVVTVEIERKKDNPAYLSVDGGDHIALERGDIVKVSESEKMTSLVLLSERSFYNRLSAKLISR